MLRELGLLSLKGRRVRKNSVCTNTWWKGIEKMEPDSSEWDPVKAQVARGTS